MVQMIENTEVRQLSDIRPGLTDFFMLADIHFGIFANNEEWRDNIEDYFNNFFIPLLRERMTPGSFLIVLGDVYDDRKSIDIDVNNRCIEIFERISSMLPVIILSGNHDIYKKTILNSNITSLKSLEHIPNLTMLSHPVRYWQGDKSLFLLPYLGDYTLETKFLNENRNSDYIFMHDEIKSGLKFDNGRDITNGVSTEGITGRIYSGHIHTRQTEGKVTYIGNPFHARKSDINNTKGVYHINLSDGREEFIENRYSPIYQKVWLNDLLEMTYAEACKILGNNYTDIIVDGADTDKFRSTDLTEEVKPYHPKKILFPVINTKRQMLAESAGSQRTHGQNIPEIIHGLIDNMDLDKGKKIRLKSLADKYQKMADEGN